jgi:hypothetical protein
MLLDGFSYDPELLASLTTAPQTIPGVLATMQAIDALTVDGDGLKWFNWLYFHVTQAVETRVQAGGFTDAAFLAELDVQFAQLYFNALKASLSNAALPGCWQALFSRRNQTSLARIQCALAGMNAHINHDLPLALVSTCQSMNLVPQHGSSQYSDYTSINATLDGLIEEAKQEMHVRLLGAVMPPVSVLENTVAAWSMTAAREAAWKNAELLWHLRGESLLTTGFLDTLDGFTTVVGKGLLIQIP